MSSVGIFVINMKHCTERMAKIDVLLKSMNLPYERVEAVIGSELSDTEIQRTYDAETNRRKHNRSLTVGEIGCYASHRKAWQQASDSEYQHLLILEDDITVDTSLTELLSEIVKVSNYGLVKLFDNRNNSTYDQCLLGQSWQIVNYKKVPNGGQGYFISRTAIDKLLKLKRFYRPVDIDFQLYSDFGFSVCGIKPYIIQCRGVKSEIELQNQGRHSSRSHNFYSNLKYRLRIFFKRQFKSCDLSELTISK